MKRILDISRTDKPNLSVLSFSLKFYMTSPVSNGPAGGLKKMAIACTRSTSLFGNEKELDVLNQAHPQQN